MAGSLIEMANYTSDCGGRARFLHLAKRFQQYGLSIQFSESGVIRHGSQEEEELEPEVGKWIEALDETSRGSEARRLEEGSGEEDRTGRGIRRTKRQEEDSSARSVGPEVVERITHELFAR
jgi:hypothetical protein